MKNWKVIFAFIIILNFSPVLLSWPFNGPITKATDSESKNDNCNESKNKLLGEINLQQGNYLQAVKYFESIKSCNNSSGYNRCWAMYNLGFCYFALNKPKLSEQNLDSCIILGISIDLNRDSKIAKLRFGMDSIYTNWIILESIHFKFHFQDTTGHHVASYIEKMECTFEFINEFFKTDLPKKIDYFVWENIEKANKILNYNLSFTLSNMYLTHSTFIISIGHEMTHSLLRKTVPISKENELIKEGLCVYFDHSGRDYFQILKNMNIRVSIVSIWKNPKNVDDIVIYTLGAELVKRLIVNFGEKKFIGFLENQTYENAQIVFGEKLSKVIKEFENEINPK